MKVSLKWLRRYIDLDYPVQKISEILTDIGLEVEGLEEVETIKGGLRGVVIGHVLEKSAHPNADKLSLIKLDAGGEEPLSIVCGAPNVAAGQKVLVATVGTDLYTPEGEAWTIKKSKIRGELSEGMICAEDELGLGNSHEGIMVLPDDVKVGTPASDYFNIESDYVFEIGLTPNRSDATSHYGVAKDLAAYLKINEGHSGKVKNAEASDFNVDRNDRPFNVKVLNQEACPRYSGITITNIEVKESPEWLKTLLLSIGVRPISNIVDITNFILHDLGQPLHAFDADKLNSDQIIVDTLPDQTKFISLDEKERKLSSHDLMINDGEKNGLCIAGVFGGMNSGVTDETKTIFLESAHFNAGWIRKTSTRHLLRTDAAKVFEKGSDPNITVLALKRAAMMMVELANGLICSEIVDVYPKNIEPKEIVLKNSRLQQLTGANISVSEMNDILMAMEMSIKPIDEDSFLVKVPTNKSDVLREADLIEEVLRIYGFNKVAIPTKVKSSISYSDYPGKNFIINKMASYLANNGFNEMMGLSLIESKYYREILPMDEDQLVFINNTSNIHLDIMRPEPMLSGLESIVRNQNYQQSDLRLFEIGRSYTKTAGDEFEEKEFFSIFINGKRKAESWLNTTNKSVDFFDIKQWVTWLLESLNISKYQTLELEDNRFDVCIGLQSNNKTLVKFGSISTAIKKKMDLREDVYFAEFDVKSIVDVAQKTNFVVHPISKYPSTRRDLALVCDEATNFGDIQKIAKQTSKQVLKEIDLFDVYRNKEQLGDNKKSYAVKFIFGDQSKTLSDKEVDKLMSKMTHRFEKELGAFIRS